MNSASSSSSSSQIETNLNENVLIEKFSTLFNSAAKKSDDCVESEAINESQYSAIKLMIIQIIDFFSADEEVLKKKDFIELNEYRKVLKMLDLNHMKSS